MGHGRSRSFKVIELVTNRKYECDFLSVTDSDLRQISHCFLDIATKTLEIAMSNHPSLI